MAMRSSSGRKWFLAALVLLSAQPVAGQVWVQRGPRPNTQGQVENIADLEVAGGVNVVATHPANPDILYIGAVNGGVWRTLNARASQPTWMEILGESRSASIGALVFDRADTTNNTLVAGNGGYSSFGYDADLAGLWRTPDGGATWSQIGDSSVVGSNITGIAARGSVIVVTSNRGVFRTTDTGATWSRISGTPGTGLPSGIALDLEGADDPGRLYTSAGRAGIYRTNDTGRTWNRLGDPALDAAVSQADRIEIAAGRGNVLYVALVFPRLISGERRGYLGGLFRSRDGGSTWAPIDTPTTLEGSARVGIHPGWQGLLHLSIVADRGNDNVVYLGGDRQPNRTEYGKGGKPYWPNSIGAHDYSGRIFRIDASLAPGRQSLPVTHSFTAHGSAPHADSRDMAIDAAGDLIEADDGGVYRRAEPRLRTGDWFSINGNLNVTEVHSVAWDAVSKVAISGTQDTGTPEESHPVDPRWRSVSTADGGDVAVDDKSTPGFSIRFSSEQELGKLRRQTFDANNNRVSETFAKLSVVSGDTAFKPQFYTPIQLNSVVPTRMIIGAKNAIYESWDRGDTMEEIGPGLTINGIGRDPIGFGARDNVEALYVGVGDAVYVRQRRRAPLARSSTYPGATWYIQDLVVDPDTGRVAYVASAANVFATRDAGATWTDLTANLPSLNAGDILSVALSTSDSVRTLIVGTTTGVYASKGPSFRTWFKFGTGLPRACVFDLAYSSVDHVLVAGTLGRGTWTLQLR